MYINFFSYSLRLSREYACVTCHWKSGYLCTSSSLLTLVSVLASFWERERERERDVWSQAHAGLSNMMLCVINHKIQKVGIGGND